MKNKMLKAVIASAFLLMSYVTYAQDKVIPYSDVPSQIKSYIKTHFPNHNVIQSEIDKEGLSRKYEINLNEGVKLEFNSKFQIVEIDGNSKLPESVVPQKIKQYIAANYPNNVITDWEKDGKKQKVGLDSDLDLEFTLAGEFIRIDR